MKAWQISPKNEFYSVVIFAETRNKAKYMALSMEEFWDNEYIDLVAWRLPKADNLYNNRNRMDWDNSEDRIFLVKECNWNCGEYYDYDDCKDCCANQWCGIWQDYLIYDSKNEVDQ